MRFIGLRFLAVDKSKTNKAIESPPRTHTMEESNELHSEENKNSQDNNKKRKLKTPAQLMALEKFYNEHKYPTEEMKSQLAEQLRLSEKQISGWFCHRRLKDKRLLRDETQANGRQDRSSVVIQDRASGLGQDSCGSTKHGEHRFVDPREVESRRLSGHDFTAADITREYRSHYTERIGDMDNTSLESSSSLQDRLLTRKEDPYDVETSRYRTHTKGMENMGYKPSGFLKVKGEAENAAITAVKRQLGRQYWEDGPLLGVEFDLLPPGAFESPIIGSSHEPSTIGNTVLRSPDISGVKGQLSPSTRYEVYNSRLNSQQENPSIMHGFDLQEKKSGKQLRQKLTYLNDTNSSPGKNSSLDIYDKPSGGISAYNSNKKDRMRSKGNYGRKFTSEQTEPCLDEYDKFMSPKIVQRNEYLKSRPSSSMEEKFDGECKAMKDYHNPLRRMNSTDEMAVTKQARVNFPQRDYGTNSFAQMPPRKNQIKGNLTCQS
ncbi:uncharacterized protein LOC125472991 isoform X5 [Pyrus x bretschneideri]|uniref:uncharacterized protein LOC125472991 isoform X5 n=1 Tax=Pyrus x bretschneideri TaxID=225117 RepID=UPI00202FEA30|nr:uncharacterized protein LOC125472991 isoform X5 [Pyrus x bretschneideri]